MHVGEEGFERGAFIPLKSAIVLFNLLLVSFLVLLIRYDDNA